MFEPTIVLEASAVAWSTAFLVGVIGRRGPWRGGWAFSLAVGSGFYVGLAMLGVRPHWSIQEDQDRLLGLLIPTILIAESGVRALGRPSRFGLAARLVAASAVAPTILHGSIYLADLDGPGSAAWTPSQRGLILGALGLAAGCNWSAQVRLQDRSPSAAVGVLAQAAALLGAGPAIALSGYASAGLIAVLLALALLGASTAPGSRPGPGVGFVGLFSLLTMGAFFGRLGAVEAGVLFLAPLLAGVPELVLRSGSTPWRRAVLGLALTACGSAVVIASAWRRFASVAPPF